MITSFGAHTVKASELATLFGKDPGQAAGFVLIMLEHDDPAPSVFVDTADLGEVLEVLGVTVAGIAQSITSLPPGDGS